MSVMTVGVTHLIPVAQAIAAAHRVDCDLPLGDRHDSQQVIGQEAARHLALLSRNNVRTFKKVYAHRRKDWGVVPKGAAASAIWPDLPPFETLTLNRALALHASDALDCLAYNLSNREGLPLTRKETAALLWLQTKMTWVLQNALKQIA